jgi:hypothetical protein
MAARSRVADPGLAREVTQRQGLDAALPEGPLGLFTPTLATGAVLGGALGIAWNLA